MTYDTDNPLGSSDPRDLFDNAGNFDRYVNGTDEVAIDRFGQPRFTPQAFHNLTLNAGNQISQTVAAAKEAVNSTADAAIEEMQETASTLGDDLNNKHYSTYAEMVASPQDRDAVTAVVDADPDPMRNGWYFWGLAANSWKYFTVQPVQQPELKAQIEKRIPPVAGVSSRRVPLVSTDSGQVPVWLTDGLLDAVGIAPNLKHLSTQDIVSRLATVDSRRLPLIHTALGQVVMWLEDGKINGAGLHSTIQELINSALADFQPAGPVTVTDSSTMYAYRAKVAKALGGTGQARVIFTGDSWAEYLEGTAQPLANALYEAYGQAGLGWVSVDATGGGTAAPLKRQLLNGARLEKTGFAILDMDPSQCKSLDGHAISATGQAATLAISNLQTESLSWYYLDGNGTFRYAVDGGSPVVVQGGGTGERAAIEITGLSNSPHTIAFDLVGNSGTVVMYGGMATRSGAGVEFSKAGNSGSNAVQWGAMSSVVEEYSAALKPDLVIVILGTNDLIQNISKADFKSGIQAMVAAYHEGSPNCSVLLVNPTRSQNATDLGLIQQYGEAMIELTKTMDNVEFLNLNSYMPPRIVTEPLGLWSDAVHLTDDGGRFVTGLLMKYLLRVN